MDRLSLDLDGDHHTLDVEQLYREFTGTTPTEANGSPTVPDATDEAPADRSARLVDGTMATLYPMDRFRFDEGVVKASLEDLLLLLVLTRGEETHGKGLMDDLGRLFDARLSPGTVYPRLHDLAEEGLLDSVEKVRTKE